MAELDKTKRAPPLRLTDDLIAQIARKVRAGNCKTVAAKALRIHDFTFTRWLGRGKKAPLGSIYRKLFDAVGEAEAEWEAEMVEIIRADAQDDGNVKSAQWLLMRHPSAKQRWASADNVAPAAPLTSEVDLEQARNTFIARMTELAKALQAPAPVEEAPPDGDATKPS